MNKQKHIMLNGGQPVTVNLKWKVISQAEADVKIESIYDDTTGMPLTDYFSESEKQAILKDALAEFHNIK